MSYFFRYPEKTFSIMLKHHGLWIILTPRMLLVINIGKKEQILLLGNNFKKYLINDFKISIEYLISTQMDLLVKRSLDG